MSNSNSGKMTLNHLNTKKNHVIIITLVLLMLTFTIPSTRTQGTSITTANATATTTAITTAIATANAITTIPQETTTNSNSTRGGEDLNNRRKGEDLSPPFNDTDINPYANFTRENDYPLDVASYLTGLTLLSSGTISLFRGNKYKWYSIFIAAFYVAAITILLFILKFQNVTNPSSISRLVYFILCSGIGSLAGLFFVCLWPTGRILVGAIGGFSLSMFVLSTKTDGIFTNQIIRYFWIGIFVTIFGASAGLRNYYHYIAIISTVTTGCYCLLLGVDIFVRAGILASFKLFWGFTQPHDYRYIVDENARTMLLSIGIAGGVCGLVIQSLEWAASVRQQRQQQKGRLSKEESESSSSSSNNNNNHHHHHHHHHHQGNDNLSSIKIKQKFTLLRNYK